MSPLEGMALIAGFFLFFNGLGEILEEKGSGFIGAVSLAIAAGIWWYA